MAISETTFTDKGVPANPYSGRFVVRTDPELHKSIAIKAKVNGKSIKVFVNELLSKSLSNKEGITASIATRGNIGE